MATMATAMTPKNVISSGIFSTRRRMTASGKLRPMTDIMAYNILSTPGLVVNEEVVCTGRIPTSAEVTTWLADALETI